MSGSFATDPLELTSLLLSRLWIPAKIPASLLRGLGAGVSGRGKNADADLEVLLELTLHSSSSLH